MKTNNKGITISFKQLYIIIPIFISIIGSSFGFGIKVTKEVNKVELSKQESKFQNELNIKDTTIIEVKRQLKESTEDNIYYKNRHEAMKDQLDNCLTELIPEK